MSKIGDLFMAMLMVLVPMSVVGALVWMLVVWTLCLVSMAESLRKIAEKLG